MNLWQERGREKTQRQNVLSALYIQTENLSKINAHNQHIGESPYFIPIPYPVVSFETAFFSQERINVSQDTIEATSGFLTKARELNAIIEMVHNSHLSKEAQEAIGFGEDFLYGQVKREMSSKIEQLKASLEKELKRK